MGQIFEEIVQQLYVVNKKVQLIYVFNGIGKICLFCVMKNEIVLKNFEDDEFVLVRWKFLYYSVFIEDLFVWDNDIEGDED